MLLLLNMPSLSLTQGSAGGANLIGAYIYNLGLFVPIVLLFRKSILAEFAFLFNSDVPGEVGDWKNQMSKGLQRDVKGEDQLTKGQSSKPR